MSEGGKAYSSLDGMKGDSGGKEGESWDGTEDSNLDEKGY